MSAYANDVLVTVSWLAEHLEEPGLAVAEVDENPALYDKRHMPERVSSRGGGVFEVSIKHPKLTQTGGTVSLRNRSVGRRRQPRRADSVRCLRA